MAYIWLLLGIAVVVQGQNVTDDGDEDLNEWPSQFTVKAIRTSLTDHVIERYEVWRTSKRSRIDYNDGYVKSFVKTGKPYRYGIKYMITPEASFDQQIEMVCNGRPGDSYDRAVPETILPEDVMIYDKVGNEEINDKNCVKFKYDSTETGLDSRRTVWAVYEKDIWIPVRYEVLEFNLWLGSKDKHEVWDFYDFQRSFSLRSVFDVDNFNCSSESALLSPHEKRTKDLLFVDPDKDHHVNDVFDAYKKNFGRSYATEEEHNMRKSIFKNKLRHVIETNRQNLGYKLGVNQFTDKTPEEMTKYMGLLRRPEGKVGNIAFPYDEDKINEILENVPAEYDTRLLGLVTKIKNQEECGSCWTFGTTAAVEGALARVNGGRLMSLSNQALVDCAWAFGAAGCNGGTDNAAYEWMMQYGLPTEAEYGSYLNLDGPCRILNMTKTYPIRGYTDVTPLSVGALKVALVNHGPLSVSVDVTSEFGAYSSGIFYDTSCSQTELNHEVTLVGYGEKDGDTFWILKNSWGSNWGIGGYMYISARDNNCGVATEPTYVVI